MQLPNNPIGVIDSGVGGLTVVKELQRQLPKESILYFGDSKNMPYGNKTPEEIIALTKKMLSFLDNHQVKAILLACNTISSQINELIPLTDTPIFDIIYPGCVAAVENIPKRGVGLIATEATVSSNTYGETLQSIQAGIPFIANGSPDLARVIEENNENQEGIKRILEDTISPLLAQKPVDNLILGCTHYPFVMEEIQKLYPHLQLIDPAIKLVDILKGYLEESDLFSSDSKSTLTIYTSGQMDNYLPFIDRLNIKNYDLFMQSLD